MSVPSPSATRGLLLPKLMSGELRVMRGGAHRLEST